MTSKSFESVAELFVHRITKTPNRDAFEFPNAADTGWERITWKQTGERVRAIAMGLNAMGVEPEQRCALLATTRVDWIIADLGILCAGAATTTVYPSSTADESAYILSDSDSVIAFAEDDAQVEKLLSKRDELPTLRQIITFDGTPGHDGFVISLSELERQGREHDAANEGRFDAIVSAIKKDHLATLIYTSGTTGRPKGVELIHDCWVYEGEAIEGIGILGLEDHQYLWLPLAHSFGKVLEAAQLQIGFLTTVDGRIPKLVDNLATVRPTFMAAAPRIFEKVYNKVITGAESAGGLKIKILRWAIGLGNRVSKLRQAGKEPAGLLALQFRIADKLVFSKLRARFGGKLRFFVSGSAPLSLDMAEFFHAAGILILEGYGLTESSAATFVNTLQKWRFGTVGPALEGTELKIEPTNSEIWLRGRGVMRGYHNLPEVTAETLDSDGWLHTGDVGEVDGDGMLRITDRIKDLIKTSGGKYVAPQKLESRLKALCPYLGQVLVHGNARNFCSALVTLDPESIPQWAEDRGIHGKSYLELTQDADASAMVQEAINKLNSELNPWETIKKFAILPKDLSLEEGDMTPSMKVKRKAIEAKYADLLAGFYAGTLK